MEPVPANKGVETCRFSITPLIHFAADWPALRYDFSHGVFIVHNSEHAADLMIERLCHAPDGLDEQMSTAMPELADISIETSADAIREADWLFIMLSFQQATFVPTKYNESCGFILPDSYGDYADSLRKVYRKSFMNALRLFGCGVATPFHFLADAELTAEGIQAVTPFRCEWDHHFLLQDGPGIYIHASSRNYEIGKEQQEKLSLVWEGLADLRKLGQWADKVCDENFWPEIRSSGLRAKENILKAKGDPKEAEEAYKSAISRTFRKMEKQTLGEGTRMNLLLQLFESAAQRAQPEAFLAMCTVLEAVFCSDSQEGIAHRLATRAARFIRSGRAGYDAERRLKCYKAVKEMYKVRSRLVHGDDLVWVSSKKAPGNQANNQSEDTNIRAAEIAW